MDKQEAEKKIKDLHAIINGAINEMSHVGVAADIGVYLTLPDGWHGVELVNRSFIKDTLSNYGWESSSEDALTDDELCHAFEQETGQAVDLGDWISSSALC